MKMSRFEKMFVNSPAHSGKVALQAVRRLANLNILPKQTYLDVGCGNGAAAFGIAAEYDLNVTGIDIDPEQIYIAQQRAPRLGSIRFLVGDAACLPFEDAAFDLVATQKTTHHMRNWEAALAEIVRVLKPGGYFIYSDLVAPGWIASLARVISTDWDGLPTLAGLDRFFAERSLRVIRRATYGLSYEAILHRQ